MKNIILSLYIKYKALLYKLRVLVNYVKFIKFIIKIGIFGKGEPTLLLELLSKYITLEAPEFSQATVMNRDASKSALLFRALVNTYLQTHAITTLEQLLEVLKNEFIRRDEK